MAFEFEPGLYRTTKYLPGNEAQVGPDQLILIRTDGEFAPASVLLPIRNEHNQWRFAMPGVPVPSTSLDWGTTLKKLPREGFYRLLEEMSFGETGKLTYNAVVQLGYTQKGEAILFVATRRSPLVSNDLWFSDRGMRIEDAKLDKLEPLTWYAEPEKTG